MQPKVILVEEAGQVLEAHSLATLVPSVEHLIMIGDPLQLRPTINTYGSSPSNFEFRILITMKPSRLRIPMVASFTNLTDQ
jgi:superfamily I DNA and/or RNA helicase